MMKRFAILQLCVISLLMYWMLPALSQSQNSRKPPALIRDTGVAEGKENTDAEKTKEVNPLLAEQNVDIGNFYFKKKNYAAAIQRYLEAIEYQPDSIRAYEALTRAYEKNGEPAKAINAYKAFIKNYPNSPKAPEFRGKIAKLEKKSS